MGIEKKLSDLQKQYMDNDAYKPDRQAIHDSWFSTDTVDYWRHKRMYDSIQPLAEKYKTSKWLTIGDGRFGLDSIRLKNIFGIENVFPTDIGDNMLRISKQKGLIDNYGVENAENLSFADDQFDIIFCKESFHHFPRPYLALYEMLRVARVAVILIEPAERNFNDGVKSRSYITSAFKLLYSKMIGKHFDPYIPHSNKLVHDFEEAGNYLYAVSTRELEKLVHGMNLGGMAYKRFNDMYIKGCEFEKAEEGNHMFKKIKAAVLEGDELYMQNPQYYQPNMVTTILMKNDFDNDLCKGLRNSGFEIIEKVNNPYLSENKA